MMFIIGERTLSLYSRRALGNQDVRVGVDIPADREEQTAPRGETLSHIPAFKDKIGEWSRADKVCRSTRSGPIRRKWSQSCFRSGGNFGCGKTAYASNSLVNPSAEIVEHVVTGTHGEGDDRHGRGFIGGL